MYDRDATLPGSSGWGHNNLAIPPRLHKGDVVFIYAGIRDLLP